MNKGFSLVEIVVSMGIFSIIVFAVVEVFIVSNEAAQLGNTKAKALPLITEYVEKIRNIRRSNWTLLADGRYVITTNNGDLTLALTTTGETIDDVYTRFLDIASTFRDVNGNLAASGTPDPSTKKITVTVSWTGVHPGQLVESGYLTRYLDNLAWTQTTQTDFNKGTTHGTTAVVATAGTGIPDDGQVQLGAGGGGDWCKPSDSIVAKFDLPGQAQANAITAIEGRAFIGTGRNASGEPFVDVDTSHLPQISILNKLVTSPQLKTTDAFSSPGSNYAYITTENPNKEMVIIDLTTSPYSEAGYFNAPGSSDGKSVYVVGNVGYVTAGSNFYSVDLSSKSGDRGAPLSTVGLSGEGLSIYVRGNYAYVAEDSTSRQMEIINITNPRSLSIVGWIKVNNASGRDVYVEETETRAYLVTSSANPDFYIIDVSQKNNPKKLKNADGTDAGIYSTGVMDPKGVRVVPGGRVIIVGSGGEQYQVLDISDSTKEKAPIRCGGVTVGVDIYAIDAVLGADGSAYSYILTADAANELQVIRGGPGGLYATYGVYESQTLDTHYPTAFNRLFVNFNAPSPTSILFQVAAKDANVSGNCTGVTFSDFDFVGPNGTSSDWFHGGGAIPFDNDGLNFENPAQCFRLRAYLSTPTSSLSPVFYDFSVNYSP